MTRMITTTPPVPLPPSGPDFSSARPALIGIAALRWMVLYFHLTPALFAALLIFGGTRALTALLERARPGLRHAQVWGLLLLVAGLGSLGVELAVEAAADGGGYGALLQQMATALKQLRAVLPPCLAAHLPVSLEGLREAAVTWLRTHASQLQLWGGHTVRGLGYTLAGVVIGALAALQLPVRPEGEGGCPPLEATLRRGFDGLVESFTAVVFAQLCIALINTAQLRIALINTALTAVYLLAVLPLIGTPLPLAGTLVAATFVASLVPVVGNLVSNTMIVVVSLTQSVTIAGLSLAWLVGIHKLEYFLNAQIIGHRIRAQAWELLIAMITFEAIFGLGGLIAAPVAYAQLKRSLQQRGWL